MNSKHDYEHGDELESYRPSLVKLTNDVANLRDDLEQGFSSREELLLWLQRACVRTLGEIPMRVIDEIGRQFRPLRGDEDEGVLLAALLTGAARDRDIPEDVAMNLRRQLAAEYLEPAAVRAFERLRADAGEYVESSHDGSEHDPARQRHIAMRPALDEIDENQQQALRELLDGFEDKSELMDWTDLLQLATHGELSEGFITRLFNEHATIKMLTGELDKHRRARQLFAAYYIIPLYNAGVRDLSGRATEQPSSEAKDHEVTPA